LDRVKGFFSIRYHVKDLSPDPRAHARLYIVYYLISTLRV